MTPRMQVVWAVLECAKDVGDAMVLGACRRLIEADRLGWCKHLNADDWALVRGFAAVAGLEVRLR
jgi:hypothetical protein